MKKNLLMITLTILGAVVLATLALAATTVSLSPANINVSQGKIFNVTVAVNPQSVNNYTAKIQLNYPADILQVESFGFGNNWMSLSQSGYDLIDNTNGVLIKTAGYPGGLSQTANFGTVSFYAKKVGNGIIKIGNGSLALDVNNQNVLSGTSEVAFVVTAAAPITPKNPAISTPPAVTPAVPKTPVAPAPKPTIEQPIEQPVAQQVPQSSLLAALGIVLTLGTGNIWLGILIGLIIFTIVVYAIYSFIKRK